MSDSFLDRLPSNEREKIRKRMRSPEAYEHLREKVKGPEDLEKEMDRSEKLAEAHLAMESDPRLKELLKSSIEQSISEQGIDALVDTENISAETRAAIEQGKFDVAIDTHPETNDDALVMVSEGNVQEKIPVKQSFAEKYIAQVMGPKK